MTKPLQTCRQLNGDREASVFEVRRFTRQEHERGDTGNWWRTGAWYRRDSGLEWAWFRREVSDGEAKTVP